MRVSLIALFISIAAHAHLVVDMKVSVRAPAFVAAGQPFTYEVIADDLANDNAFGVVVTDTLPAGVTFTGTTAPGWKCGVSKSIVTCSAEELKPGEHVIAIRVTAPSQPGTLVNKAHVTSIGSSDPVATNDDATNTAIVYQPASCTAAAPALVSPAEDLSTVWVEADAYEHDLPRSLSSPRGTASSCSWPAPCSSAPARGPRSTRR